MNTDTATGLKTPPQVVRNRGCPGRVQANPGTRAEPCERDDAGRAWNALALLFPGFRYLRMPSVSMTLRYLFRFSDFR